MKTNQQGFWNSSKNVHKFGLLLTKILTYETIGPIFISESAFLLGARQHISGFFIVYW